jgi:hypothetical protein
MMILEEREVIKALGAIVLECFLEKFIVTRAEKAGDG